MNFISTRGGEERVSAAYAIKNGLAKDGGLYMPESIPSLTEDEIKKISGLSYSERAAYIIGKFLTDYTYEELLEDAKGAYAEEKFGPSAAPVTKLSENTYMLELWHGPTSAFKDMALQIMPRLFVRALRKTGEKRNALILVATSGDTGKAALEGYKDIDGTSIQVFYPTDGVSRVQKLQMQTQEGGNVKVIGIRGNFDDAQSGVKRIFADMDMVRTLDDAGTFLSSANSINWGRLVPQIVYYVSAYCDMLASGALKYGDKLDVCVPTGNFGNIFACYIAKLMGLPIGRLICASNKNNVLTDFLESGTYNRVRPFHQTISPSMDILISSNLERLLYLVCGQKKTAEYMNALANDGGYTLDGEDFAKIKESFLGYYTDEEETKATIRCVYENKNCLIDTHTAVAHHAAEEYMNEYETERKILVVSTASPYKFAKDVYVSLRGESSALQFSDDTEALDALEAYTGVKIPVPLSGLTAKVILHSDIIDKEDMDSAVVGFAKA